MADWKSSQEFLKEFYASPIVNEDTISAKIKRIFLPKSRKASALKELAGDFCRGCGYCMPCPKGIQINQCARMSLMLRRAPAASWLNDHWQAEMKKIEELDLGENVFMNHENAEDIDKFFKMFHVGQT